MLLYVEDIPKRIKTKYRIFHVDILLKACHNELTSSTYSILSSINSIPFIGIILLQQFYYLQND
jgi:hypothetical protein